MSYEQRKKRAKRSKQAKDTQGTVERRVSMKNDFRKSVLIDYRLVMAISVLVLVIKVAMTH